MFLLIACGLSKILQKGFILPKSDDGLLEIFGLIDGWHASLVMLSLRSAKRLAQVKKDKKSWPVFQFTLVCDRFFVAFQG
jgi:hypothetical protein